MIGVMQGRLTPKDKFLPQQFPWLEWEKEFDTARTLKLEYLEWMFNAEDYKRNPFFTENGIQRIAAKIEETGVKINSVCANYFMQHSITALGADNAENMEILEKLLVHSEKINCRYVIIPLFEKSILVYEEEKQRLIEILQKVLGHTASRHTEILLETEWTAEQQRQFFVKLNQNRAGCCYDVGNSAGCGYPVEKEIMELKPWIREIHIKDKQLHGTSVMLGEGCVPFEAVFKGLADYGYQHDFILETYYGSNTLEDTIKNYEFVKGLVELL